MIRTARRRFALSTLVAAVAFVTAVGARQSSVEPYGGRAEFLADLAARRAKALDAFAADTALVLWSAPARVYSDDTNYEFRQESNLLYLSGFNRENATLVLVPGATGAREFLFVPASDSVPGALERPHCHRRRSPSGHGRSAGLCARRHGSLRRVHARPDGPGSGHAEHAADGRRGRRSPRGADSRSIQIALLDFRPAGGAPVRDVEAMRQATWTSGFQQGSGRPVTFVNATPRLDAHRQIKTAYEQKVLRRSVEISAEAHVEGMKATRPGRWEYEVEAAIEYWFLKNGAMSWGYPVDRRQRTERDDAALLESTRQMQAGDLLLVDAAGNFQGLTGDITRTYPVSGRFTPIRRRSTSSCWPLRRQASPPLGLAPRVGHHPRGPRRRSARECSSSGSINGASRR